MSKEIFFQYVRGLLGRFSYIFSTFSVQFSGRSLIEVFDDFGRADMTGLILITSVRLQSKNGGKNAAMGTRIEGQLDRSA